jgi:uncharacterized protein (DUF885 family)
MTMNRAVYVLLFVLLALPSGLGREPAETGVAADLHALLAEDWEWYLRENPELATYLGVHSYDDQLTDLSMKGLEARKHRQREMLDRISDLDRSGLAGQDRISYDLFLREKKLEVKAQEFSLGLLPVSQLYFTLFYPVTQLWGPQVDFPQLTEATRFRTEQDYENYLSRLHAFHGYIRQVIDLMKHGVSTGWLPPAVPLRSVTAQMTGQIVDDPTRSPLYSPFTSIPDDIPERTRIGLVERGKREVEQSVIPAFRELREYFVSVYLPACLDTIAASALPDGSSWYEYLVQRETTTDLTPAEIHELGKREMSRIRQAMDGIIRTTGFQGSFREFITVLRHDPRFYHTTPQELVTGYRDICKRADAQLPGLFAVLPRNQYGVRETPAFSAPSSTTGFYTPGAADGSRPGYFLVNTYKLDTRPTYEMEALSLHEAVPGHHVQVSRAQELLDLPEFRRNAGYTAYVEGWALYAESLGDEMGFYTDPYSKFGQLTYEMWRACRLVVDTGIHHYGWSRQRAIDLMTENTAKTENDIAVEVDRYIVWPGQALAYKIGELKIKELREKAMKMLGQRFDLRKFHNVILDNGPLPLDMLGNEVEAWIAGQSQR